jgi:putative aminopeptidase FrvX
MNIKQQLVELLEIHGVSGNEKPVRDYLEPILTDIMDETIIDDYGNLLGVLKVGTGEGATILLSAHMDTVRGVRKDKKVVEKDGIFRAELPDGTSGVLGADDRAGIAIILTALRNIPKSFNGTIKVAFSREEEIGCVGAEQISREFLDYVDLAIVVDRRGNRDIVIGCDMAFCSNNVGDFMEHVSEVADMDWNCVEGGISDAMSFATRGVNSINLSAGYQNEHTTNEFVSIWNMQDTTKLIIQALALVNGFYHTFGEVPDGNKWIKQSRTRHQYRDYYFEDEMIWEEESDENGDVYAYAIDDDIVIRQGGNEIRMNEDNFLKLYDKVFDALANKVKV